MSVATKPDENLTANEFQLLHRPQDAGHLAFQHALDAQSAALPRSQNVDSSLVSRCEGCGCKWSIRFQDSILFNICSP